MVRIREMLTRLNAAGVEYVIIGGVAANLHGSPLLTQDLDVCCPMTEGNMERLIAAIGPLHPVFRSDPRRIMLPTDPAELSHREKDKVGVMHLIAVKKRISQQKPGPQ